MHWVQLEKHKDISTSTHITPLPHFTMSHSLSRTQSLHLCVVTDGEWRWTKPFSIAEDGSRNVEVYIGRHTAVVNVCVTNIGGLQKKVRKLTYFYFFSSLDCLFSRLYITSFFFLFTL